MADKDNMSIEEILAACRNADGEGGGSAAAPAPAAESAPVPEAAAPPAAAAPASGKPAGEMSVEEIMAAARGGASAAKKDAAPAAAPAAATGPAKKPSEMSVAEMLAAARGEKSAAAPAKAAPAGGKKAAAAAVAKASPKAPAAAAAGPRDTSSILAAARKPAKPGPMSKAEAAAKGKPVKAKPVAPPMPEKPAYAMPKPAPVDEDRRGMMTILFGSFLAIGFGALATWGGLVSLGLARFMFPNILTEPPSQFKVGFPSDFSPDTVTTKFKAQYGVWVVNSEYEGQQMITALKSVCTHLGCTPNWLEGEQKFKCPCHGSGFYKDGVNFEGPAPRPLERYAIRVSDDGQIEIDKSKKFQQEMGQWTNSSSFVPV